MPTLISVIIPLYNAEQFIARALDSLLEQSFTSFEIIIVNDGSTDNSLQICNTYKRTESRIHIYSQNNAGVGAARNYGLQVATGELVFFLDADDYLLKNAFEMLVDGYNDNNNKSMVVGGVFRQSPEGEICNQNSPTNIGILPFFDKHTLLDKTEILDCVLKYLETNHLYLVSHCWGRLYNRNLIEKHSIRFNEKMRLGEDGSFNIKYLTNVELIIIVNEPLYCFQMHKNHISQSLLMINSESILHDFSTLKYDLIAYISSITTNSFQSMKSINSWIVTILISQLIRTSWVLDSVRYSAVYQEIKILINSEFVQECLIHYSPKQGHSKLIPFLMKLKLVRLLIYFCRKRAVKRYGMGQPAVIANERYSVMKSEDYKVMTQKEILLNKLRNSSCPVIICGADRVGKAILNICREAGVQIEGFADYKPSLTGTVISGAKVYYTPTISTIFQEAIYIISVLSIGKVVDVLQNQGIQSWIAGGILLEEFDTEQTDHESFLINQEKFDVESCRVSHLAYLGKDYTFLRSIDIMITERCSLKCKECSNLMQYFEHPKDIDLTELLNTMDHLLQYVDEIMEVRIIGGDAFMNRDWSIITEKAISSDKVRQVIVYTNGIIIPDLNDIRLLSNEKVVVYVTDYGKLSANLGKITDLFVTHKVLHRIDKIDIWLDCASIHKHNRTEEQNNKLFLECVSTSLITFTDGKLFRCPFAASAFRLGAVEDCATDYVNVSELVQKNVDILVGKKLLRDYIASTKALRICDYCSSRRLESVITPAEQTGKPLKYLKVREHTVSEASF